MNFSDYNQIDEQIQNTPISTLKNMVEGVAFGVFTRTVELSEEDLEEEQFLNEKALKTGLSAQSILRIEQNPKEATLSELDSYCKGLGLNLRDFIGA